MINRKTLPDHARFGPSSMDRIMACPGSVKLSDKAPAEKESEFAAEGTRAHELGELILAGGYVSASDYIKDKGGDYPDDMIEAVDKYVEYVDSIDTGECYLEEKLLFDRELFGTADAIVVDGDTLHIIDYKHGMGVAVSPEENKQLLTYAGLALQDERLGLNGQVFGEIVLTIVQPRTAGEAVNSWATTQDEVNLHMLDVMAAIKVAKGRKKAPFAAGSHCRWCRCKTICPELDRMEKGIMNDDPNALDPRELEIQLNNALLVEQRIKALRAYAFQALTDGQPVPGWKLVMKRAVKKWINESDVVSFMEAHQIDQENYEVIKLITPAAAVKLIDKGSRSELDELIESKSSGTVLAPESDKREAVGTATSMARVAKQMAAINQRN